MDVRYFKEKLLQMESDLISEMEINNLTGSKNTVHLDQQSVGRLSRIDAMQAQQMALESQRRREVQLLSIRAALRRIDNDDYGYCFSCGNNIDPKRLDINPFTTSCIECAK
ncbi:TraR/DksA C4-type zinc finger protein [Vibrio parahaemolyticus]|nr:TraR/DksA C4-type zinc finger protein [Vibrio parahaemolyticus]HCH1219320.1 TraR/DksA C4-type zinc finger protein [Vibrio parahaemolyticus]